MPRMFRAMFAALVLAGSSGFVAVSARAQDDPKPGKPADQPAAAEAAPASDDAAAPATPRTYPPFRRLPTYFGMVGVSDQQKMDIYSVRGRYRAEIYELERRIEELKRKEITECESILTQAQRKLLDQLRIARGAPTSTSTATEGP